jgi:hypothetical protein
MALVSYILGGVVDPDVKGIFDSREVPRVDVQQLGIGVVVSEEESDSIGFNVFILSHLLVPRA